MFSEPRRQFLRLGVLGAASWSASPALKALALAPEEPARDVLVVLFQRGGADGLNIVVPYGDDAYYRLRPSLAIPAPTDGQAPLAARAIDLDRFFGLHPEMKPLYPLYADGKLAFVHGCGSGDQTRSHFEAMATVERGLAGENGPASGWLGRHLATLPRPEATPLRAVSLGTGLPDSLRGAANALSLSHLDDLQLHFPKARKTTSWSAALGDLYHEVADPVGRAGRETLQVLERLNRLDPAHYRPADNAVYPESELGRGLRQVACLIKGDVGLEVACLDTGGWDTHFVQSKLQPDLLRDLSRGLAALAQDLGPRLQRVTILVMTEFGRRAYENSSLGTDHGRGACWMLLGGGIAGGKVFANWKGLEAGQLEPPGDLPVTIDYRDVLAEIIRDRLGNEQLQGVFSGHTPRFLGLTRKG